MKSVVCRKRKGQLIFGFMTLFSMLVKAQDLPLVDEKNWGLDVELQHQQQNAEDKNTGKSSANSDTFSIIPYYHFGDISLSLYIPYQQISSEYVFSNEKSSVRRLCQFLNNRTPRQIQFLINRGYLNAAQVTACQNSNGSNDGNENEKQSGMGDVTLSANYYFPLDEEGVWLAGFGFSYKFDSGDADSNLGSGTSDTSVDSSIEFTMGRFSSELLLGYNFVEGDESELVNDYSFSKWGIAFALTDNVSVGNSLHYQQALIDGDDNVEWMSSFVNFTIKKKWNLHFYVAEYFSVENYPDQEMGVSIGYSF